MTSTARIEKQALRDGTPRYKAIIRRKGVPLKTRTFRTRAQAAAWAKRLEVKIMDGRALPNWQADKRTVAELVDRYVRDVVPERPKSAANKLQQLRWWKAELGELALAQVTPSVVLRCRDKLARGDSREQVRRQAGTVNRYLAVLSHAFSVASREWEWLESNPVKKVSRLKEPRGRVRFLSDEERATLLAACQGSADSRLHPLVVVAIATGARQGELLALRWPDVHLARGVATIQNSKNEDRRALPLTGPVLEVIKELGKVRRLDTDLVFAGDSGQALFPRKAWLEALRASEIEDFRFHDLRHSAASYLAMNGATLAEIAEILGHKTLAMVKRYAHLTEQHTAAVVARMNEKIFGNG